ncbi:MAG: glycosyltransferase [Myxococcales bacterium]|nr:glycosyltransferase [Myxococcales bacterium]
MPGAYSATERPPVSVVVRSYNRLDALVELIPIILGQTFTKFELVVVEQSTQKSPEQIAKLAALVRDPRIRVFPFPPLGGPRSRNESARVARGDIIVFIDDDDIPGSERWLQSLLAPLNDPHCLAVTGGDRLEGELESERPYFNPDKAERRVMSLNFLGWQRVHSRARVRKRVTTLRGGNIAVRRTTLERFGLWDECTPVEDDVSIAYRIIKAKAPEEYLYFDGFAYQIRRFDVPGGMAKRKSSSRQYSYKLFQFFHNVVAHYFPWRFVLLYPAYIYLNAFQTIDWIWGDTGDRNTTTAKAAATCWTIIATVPRHVWWLLRWGKQRIFGAPLEYAPSIQHTPTTIEAIARWEAQQTTRAA